MRAESEGAGELSVENVYGNNLRLRRRSLYALNLGIDGIGLLRHDFETIPLLIWDGLRYILNRSNTEGLLQLLTED